MSSRKKSSYNKKLSGGQLVEAVVDGIQDEDLIQVRRDQICEAALELFLDKGFASTTIRDICAKSGVNQASIYDYIANKNDILRRLLNKLWFNTDFPSLAERLENDQDIPFEENVARYLRDAWVSKRKATILVYRSIPHLQDDDITTMRSRDEAVIKELADVLRKRTGLSKKDDRAEVLANMIFFLAAFGPLRDWLNRDVDGDLIIETVSQSIAAMIDNFSK